MNKNFSLLAYLTTRANIQAMLRENARRKRVHTVWFYLHEAWTNKNSSMIKKKKSNSGCLRWGGHVLTGKGYEVLTSLRKHFAWHCLQQCAHLPDLIRCKICAFHFPRRPSFYLPLDFHSLTAVADLLHVTLDYSRQGCIVQLCSLCCGLWATLWLLL